MYFECIKYKKSNPELSNFTVSDTHIIRFPLTSLFLFVCICQVWMSNLMKLIAKHRWVKSRNRCWLSSRLPQHILFEFESRVFCQKFTPHERLVSQDWDGFNVHSTRGFASRQFDSLCFIWVCIRTVYACDRLRFGWKPKGVAQYLLWDRNLWIFFVFLIAWIFYGSYIAAVLTPDRTKYTKNVKSMACILFYTQTHSEHKNG